MTSTIAVLPAVVTCQAVQLADGRTFAVELAQPVPQFAVVHRSGDDVEILAMRDEERQAVEFAEAIALRIEAENAVGQVLQ